MVGLGGAEPGWHRFEESSLVQGPRVEGGFKHLVCSKPSLAHAVVEFP